MPHDLKFKLFQILITFILIVWISAWDILNNEI